MTKLLWHIDHLQQYIKHSLSIVLKITYFFIINIELYNVSAVISITFKFFTEIRTYKIFNFLHALHDLSLCFNKQNF
jgi:hypothetical protein